MQPLDAGEEVLVQYRHSKRPACGELVMDYGVVPGLDSLPTLPGRRLTKQRRKALGIKGSHDDMVNCEASVLLVVGVPPTGKGLSAREDWLDDMELSRPFPITQTMTTNTSMPLPPGLLAAARFISLSLSEFKAMTKGKVCLPQGHAWCVWTYLHVFGVCPQDPEDVAPQLAAPISPANERAAYSLIITAAKIQRDGIAGSSAHDTRDFVAIQDRAAAAQQAMEACGSAVEVGTDGEVAEDVVACRQRAAAELVHLQRMRNAVFIRDGERRVLTGLVKRLTKMRPR